MQAPKCRTCQTAHWSNEPCKGASLTIGQLADARRAKRASAVPEPSRQAKPCAACGSKDVEIARLRAELALVQAKAKPAPALKARRAKAAPKGDLEARRVEDRDSKQTKRRAEGRKPRPPKA